MEGAFVLQLTILGMMLASATRRFGVHNTLIYQISIIKYGHDDYTLT